MATPFQSFPAALLVLSPRLTRTGSPDASVEGINTTTLGDGCWCYCAENKGEYQLDKQDNTTPPDGNTVIAPTTGPGRWKLFSGSGGGACPALSRVYYVDASTTTPLANQTGASCAPFASIQQAIDAVPVRTTIFDVTVPWTFRIAPGIYDEDITLRDDGVVVLEAIGNPGAPFLLDIAVLLFDPIGLAPHNITVQGMPLLTGSPFAVATFRNFLFGDMLRTGDDAEIAIVFDASFAFGTIDGQPGTGELSSIGLTNGTSVATALTATHLLMKNGATVAGPATTGGATILDDSQVLELTGLTSAAGGVGLVDSAVVMLTLPAAPAGVGGTVQNSRIQAITGDASALAFDNFSTGWYAAGAPAGLDSTLAYQQFYSSEAPSGGRFIVLNAGDITPVTIARDGVNPWLPNVYMLAPPVATVSMLLLPPLPDWFGGAQYVTPGLVTFSRELIVKNRGLGTVSIVPQAGEFINGGGALAVPPGATVTLLALKGVDWETI